MAGHEFEALVAEGGGGGPHKGVNKKSSPVTKNLFVTYTTLQGISN